MASAAECRAPIDLSQIPLKALSPNSLYQLSLKLNAEKILLSDNGHLRDWRGLAQLVGLPGDEITALGSQKDCCKEVLERWSKLPNPKELPNLCSLKTIMGELDRWDVVYDTESLLEKDAEAYQSSLTRRQVDVENIMPDSALTLDDLWRLEQGLSPQIYDAFLIYADADEQHAMSILKDLEKRGLKIFVTDRDILPGVAVQSTLLELIADRCNRLIVIFSEQFLKTNLNKFLVSYAQSVGIDRNRRKVIPVTFEECTIPTQLNYNFRLKHTTSHLLYNFYDKLYESVKPLHLPPAGVSQTQTAPCAIAQKTSNSPMTSNGPTTRSCQMTSSEQTPLPAVSAEDHSFLCEQPAQPVRENNASKIDVMESGYLSVSSDNSVESKSSKNKFIKKLVPNMFKKKKKTKVALTAEM